MAAFIFHYKRLFSIGEIEASRFLRSLYWVLLIGFVLSFYRWFESDSISLGAIAQGRHLCPPYFLDCGRLYFFDSLPRSYGSSLFFAGLHAMLIGSALAAWSGRWWLAHALISVLALFKIFYIYVLTYLPVVEYEYFHLPVVLVFLLASRKAFFARRIFALTYLFSATMKFSEAWIGGTYFSTLELGLPLFAGSLIPFVTNGVALFEIFSPLFLFARRRRFRWTVIALWIAFHLYSMAFVGFLYPAYCLPLLLALFLDEPREEAETLKRSNIGWALLASIAILHILPWFIVVEKTYTLQGRRLGAQMFDANHQVFTAWTLVFNDGREQGFGHANNASTGRMSPYTAWFRARAECGRNIDLRAIRWTFDSSANGGPFYRLVETENACALSYRDFASNSWIRTPETGAPVVGYPRKNSPQSSIDARARIVYETPDPAMRVATQWFFIENLSALRAVYWLLWALSLTWFFFGHSWTRSAHQRGA